MNKFHGFLFSKLFFIGTRSEGPQYFLEQFDYHVIPIEKTSFLWEEDPKLQPFLGKKATIEGELISGRPFYDKIGPHSPEPMLKAASAHTLEVDLDLETNELYLNKMPPSPQPKPFKMVLKVKWPYRSIWQGTCPTSQIYDFIVEHEDRIIWQWSQENYFAQVFTPVMIPGGDPVTFPETWVIDPNAIQSEGIYSVRAIFIATGQEAEKQLNIKFAF